MAQALYVRQLRKHCMCATPPAPTPAVIRMYVSKYIPWNHTQCRLVGIGDGGWRGEGMRVRCGGGGFQSAEDG